MVPAEACPTIAVAAAVTIREIEADALGSCGVGLAPDWHALSGTPDEVDPASLGALAGFFFGILYLLGTLSPTTPLAC